MSVPFAGTLGTGKTVAAEILASELNLLMYRFDLQQVVNKYVGETEKNLRLMQGSPRVWT
jgi:SpoVK/Ycf46/Vps4 family AAA+-type ATPase